MMFRQLHEGQHRWTAPWPSEWWVGRHEWVAQRVAEREDVLDLGCGRATLAGYLHQAAHHEGLYVGVERDHDMVSEAVVGLAEAGLAGVVLVQDLEVDFSVADLIATYWGRAWAAGSEDPPVVVLSSVLHEVVDPLALVRSVPVGVRVLMLLEQPILGRRPDMTKVMQPYTELLVSSTVQSVVDRGGHAATGGSFPMRGWAYGVEGVRG